MTDLDDAVDQVVEETGADSSDVRMHIKGMMGYHVSLEDAKASAKRRFS